MSPPDYLRIEGLTKSFGVLRAVDALTLSVPRGEILALLGPSGSGKTTVLRLLAGFEAPDAGRVVVDGEEVTRQAPEARRFGMVFQHYALFPHLDVGENVGFGLRRAGRGGRGGGGGAVARRVAEALEMVDLAGFERRKIAELSGGQQQRVALARTLAPEPRVLLLDEPLSNLDPALRERTRRELRRAIERVGITTVFVTHEQEEAFDLGDRVAVINAGRLEQVGTADRLYESPASAFVARFVGRTSELPAELTGGPAGRLALVRPEAMRFVAEGEGAPEGEGRISGLVTARRLVGAQAYFTVRDPGGLEVEVQAPRAAASVGERVRVAVDRVLYWADGPPMPGAGSERGPALGEGEAKGEGP